MEELLVLHVFECTHAEMRENRVGKPRDALEESARGNNATHYTSLIYKESSLTSLTRRITR